MTGKVLIRDLKEISVNRARNTDFCPGILIVYF